VFTVYVLHSQLHGKIYIGFTSDIEKRFRSHNELANKGWTVRFRPWEIVHIEIFDSKRDAMRGERELKSARGRELIWQQINTK
jgi:putative endonuclease